MVENMFKKALKLDKRSTIVYAREKKYDKDAICWSNILYAPNVANLGFWKI